MSPKGKYDNTVGNQYVHKSRQQLVLGSYPKPPKKQRGRGTSSSKDLVSPLSVTTIKKKLRDVSRRLKRSESISAEVRVQDERARDAYQLELAVAEAERKRRQMIRKYHMVRFFGLTFSERQKANRLIKKIRKLILAADSIETVQLLEKQLHEAEVDLNYTLYHPLSEIYVSLYRKSSSDMKDNSNLNALKQKPHTWHEIEQAMKNGTLEKIRNRMSSRSDSTFEVQNNSSRKNTSQEHLNFTTAENRQKQHDAETQEKFKKKSTNTVKNKTPSKTQNTPNENDEDSDGSFFE